MPCALAPGRSRTEPPPQPSNWLIPSEQREREREIGAVMEQRERGLVFSRSIAYTPQHTYTNMPLVRRISHLTPHLACPHHTHTGHRSHARPHPLIHPPTDRPSERRTPRPRTPAAAAYKHDGAHAHSGGADRFRRVDKSIGQSIGQWIDRSIDR